MRCQLLVGLVWLVGQTVRWATTRAENPGGSPIRVQKQAKVLVAVVALAACSLMAATEHVVRRGDTLAGIAARYGVSVRTIADANGISDPNHIVIGQHLDIPGDDGPSRASASSSAYRVQGGDTLAQIARRVGSTISQLARANRLDDPNLIIAGQRLVIPTDGSGGGGGGGGEGSVAPVNPNARFHVVRAGESLASIASHYGVPASQIASANGIVDGRIYANARLFLESRNRPAASSGSGSSTAHHTVARGDTLAGIAARYGSSVRAIASANGIADPNRIVIGRRLDVPTGGTAGIRCPVVGARFMNDWGFPRSGHFHDGNDLFAPRGRPVVAPVSGRVEQIVGNMGGNQIRLWGSDGTSYIGSHLDSFGHAGQVSAGDVIGYVGDSGNARGGPTHLHFEIRPGNGPSVNPYPSLRNAC